MDKAPGLIKKGSDGKVVDVDTLVKQTSFSSDAEESCGTVAPSGYDSEFGFGKTRSI